MSINIEAIEKPGKGQSLVYLAGINEELNKFDFSEREIAYINKKKAEDDKLVTLNRLDHLVFLCLCDTSKSEASLLEATRKAGNRICQALNSEKLTSVAIVDHTNHSGVALAMAEGIALSNYQFLKYKKEDFKANTLSSIHIQTKMANAAEIDQLMVIIGATCISRDLVNEPQSYLNAVQLSEELEKLGNEAGIKVEVFNESKIEALKMGGLLAVNRGSQIPPTFTIMEWKPENAKNEKPIVLVGKGVVYDTGGLSLKPTPNSMDLMKCDMAGAATVAGAIYAAAKANLPVHVIALVPATDNRPGEDAYTPGDVITMHNGLNVEVLNTDAEGRMILADALSYAKKFDPMLVLDFATLTGAAAAAIGQYATVFMGTAGEDVKNKLKSCGDAVHERLVEFPFWDDYKELIKSDIAEIKNIGGPVGGAITAGKFLEYFTDYPWLHFDIAGPAFITSNDSYRVKGGTGVGVRLMFNYLKSEAGL